MQAAQKNLELRPDFEANLDRSVQQDNLDLLLDVLDDIVNQKDPPRKRKNAKKFVDSDADPFKPNPRLTCTYCLVEFITIAELKAHKKTHGSRVTCPTCGTSTPLKDFCRHRARCNVNRRTEYRCMFCELVVSDQHKLKQHYKTHPDRNQCRVCSKMIGRHRWSRHKALCQRREQLDAIAASAEEKKTFGYYETNRDLPCHVCGKVLANPTSLRQHLKATHLGERRFRCEHCGKAYSQIGSLRVHERTVHTRERPYSCTQCPKTFVTKHRLTSHLVTHAGRSNFHCGVCERFYSNRQSLNRHWRHLHPHFGVDLVCTVCGHSAAEVYVEHSKCRAQFPSNRHSCDECERSFDTMLRLETHKSVTHRGQKYFVCFLCRKTFGYKSNLKVHIKNNHIRPNE